MKKLMALFTAVFLISVTGCGKYVLKSEVEENYIPKAEVQENFVPKAALIKAIEEGFGPKSSDKAYSAVASPTDHTCRYCFIPGYCVKICMPECPINPYCQDLGVPCPQ